VPDRKIYIALDVESAGSSLGIHSTLSVGACVIDRDELSFEEYRQKGLVFYAELQPDSRAFETDAIKVGASKLVCLEDLVRAGVKQFDVSCSEFSGLKTLTKMECICESPAAAMLRFEVWVEKVRAGREAIGVTDTVFFDGGRIDYLFGKYCHGPNPFGWSGLDLDSIYRGYAQRSDANLKELGVPDQREYPHRADEDAIYLAQVGRELLFEKMKW